MPSNNQSSAEIALLHRISELARRYGLRPSEADDDLYFIADDARDSSKWRYRLDLNFVPAGPDKDRDKLDRFDKLAGSLGCDGDGQLVTKRLSEMEDIVERAHLLAPRARSR